MMSNQPAEAPQAEAAEAPATEAPQTEVAEAPATEAPQTEVAEAPATEAPQTEAAEAPATETPAEEAAATEATEAPKASESADSTSTAEAAATGETEERGRDAWRRVGAVLIVLVGAFAVVVLWARPAHEPAAPTGQRSTAPVAVTSLNPTDIAYLQLMISLNTSAGQLFDLIITGGDPVLTPIARTAADGHRAELAALRKALADGGAVEDSSIHAGHDLPGMVVDADMAAIRAAPAAQQPAKALEVLRDHLTGTTALCGSEAKNGADPATKAAAQQVLDAHGKLLAQLPTM
ncbi:hypothetical protein [Dactylosporangium sp. NPDC000521]|uniref:hypothetical protein n=1 Tax=Dactylosporangium sp. NPDC000521 TaxID=3363975 RepID=UPI003691F193